MSDDSIALENEEYEDVDVLSLIGNQAEEDVDEEDIDDDEDLDTLKERLSKRNKSLKKSKQAIHRIQEENETLQKRLDALESTVNNRRDTTDSANDEQEAQEWADRVLDNPAEAIKYADYKQKKLEAGISNWATTFEAKIMERLDALDGKTNPELQVYSDALAVLRADPDFQGMSDNELLPFARKLKNMKVRQPRGSVAGKKAPAAETSKFELPPEVKQAMGF